VTVRGVVQTSDGVPLAGARVAVTGVPVVVTDEDGRFEVFVAAVPYDVGVGYGEGVWARPMFWLGVHRTDPVLTYAATHGLERSGTVCGTITGSDANGESPWVTVELPAGSPPPQHPVGPGGGPYCAMGTWSGAESTPATLHVLQIRRTQLGTGSDMVAAGFPAYGRADATLTDGATTPGPVDLALAPVDSGALQVDATLPDGFSGELFADAFFGTPLGNGYPLASVRTLPPWPAFAYPLVPDLRTRVWVWSAGPDRSGVEVFRVVSAPEGPLHVAVGLPPVLLAPADAAAGVASGARFSWTPSADGDLSALDVACGDGYSVRVFTSAASALLPDTGRVGAALAAGASCSWEVVSIGQAGGIEGITTAAHGALADFLRIPTVDADLSFSSMRTFTAR
jgi:hypothetical protein